MTAAFGAHGTGLELILNAAESALQIGVTDDEAPVCFQDWRVPRKSAEILTDAIAEICRRLGISPQSFRRMACVVGPGSFTGIRLILTTANALRRVSRVQLAQISYLQALATTAVMHRGMLYPNEVAVVTRARARLVHFQLFRSFGPQIPAVQLGEIELVSPDDALKKIGSGTALVCGSGIEKLIEAGGNPQSAVWLPNLANPDFDALRLLARHGDYFPHDLAPLYVRPCDAEDTLSEERSRQMKEILQKSPKSEL